MSTTEHHEYSTKLGHLRFFKNLITCLPMKHIILITLSLYSFAFSLNGAKPDNAGKPDKQKTVQNQSDSHHSDSAAVNAKDQQEKKEKKEKEAKHSDDDDDDDGNDEEATDKSNNSDKTDAIRKEAGKGSETGQQQRKEHSRKWWKFWGEEEK
jgi:hypothetical protein